jgi:acyl-CoA thioester hydrolase
MYFKYIQAARVHYWESLGFDESHKTTGIGPTLAAASCQFIKPLFYPGNVIIRTKVSFIKTTSFGLQHQLLNDQGILVATAEDVIVMYNFQTQTKTPISEKLRQKIEALEGYQFDPPAT